MEPTEHELWRARPWSLRAWAGCATLMLIVLALIATIVMLL